MQDPQPPVDADTGCCLGIVVGIAYLILVVLICSVRGVFETDNLLLVLGILGLSFLGLMIYFLTQERTRSIGWGMLAALAALLVIVIAFFILYFLALQHGSPVGPIA